LSISKGFSSLRRGFWGEPDGIFKKASFVRSDISSKSGFQPSFSAFSAFFAFFANFAVY